MFHGRHSDGNQVNAGVADTQNALHRDDGIHSNGKFARRPSLPCVIITQNGIFIFRRSPVVATRQRTLLFTTAGLSEFRAEKVQALYKMAAS
jgi:hypothetical protein